jgi:hypothetical protein
MSEPLFQSLDSAAIANDIRKAQHSVCYAAPGIQRDPANAMAELARRLDPEFITVCLDFDERVMRMGFGELAAVKTLRDAGIVVNSTSGLRTGLVIVDHQGYIFTPTALYLEAEARPADAPNAMRLSKDQVTEALARLSPAAKAIAIAFAKTEEERKHIREQAVEVPSTKVIDEEFAAVGKRLEEAPPVQFDIARQVRVFNAYIQYVELKLSGAAIQRHRIAIPPSIQKLGGSKDLEGRLKTTFDLIEKEALIEGPRRHAERNSEEFHEIAGQGSRAGCAEGGKAAPRRTAVKIRDELKVHQEKVEKELQGQLDESRKQIVDYFVPHVVASPPDAMRGQFLKFEEAEARVWLDGELDRVFPKADTLIQKMQLDVRYKNATRRSLQGRDV